MDRELIKNTVVSYIISSTKHLPEQVKDCYVLSKWPLAFDKYTLAFLAIDCDRYIKTIDPAKDIFVCEVRKKNLTVEGLIDLLVNKIITEPKEITI